MTIQVFSLKTFITYNENYDAQLDLRLINVDNVYRNFILFSELFNNIMTVAI